MNINAAIGLYDGRLATMAPELDDIGMFPDGGITPSWSLALAIL
jgi:hypothetical protein